MPATGPDTSRPRIASSSRSATTSPRRCPAATGSTSTATTGAPIYPGRFAQDFNRSYVLEPDGPGERRRRPPARSDRRALQPPPHRRALCGARLRGGGDPDARPRHGARRAHRGERGRTGWRRRGSPSGKRSPAPARALPLQIVGYSNGGALAVKYALDALGDARLAKPDRLVLLSPMIGVTRFARFSGLAAWPAVFPPFIKAAWLSILPEYNPFKYNSFPVNAATPVLPADHCAAGRHRRGRPRRDDRPAAADPDVPVGDRLHRQRPRGGERRSTTASRTTAANWCCSTSTRAANVEALLRERRRHAVERLLHAGAAEVPRDRDRQCRGRGTGGCRTRDRGGRNVPRPSARSASTIRRDVFSMSHIALPFPPYGWSLRFASRAGTTTSASPSGRSRPRRDRHADRRAGHAAAQQLEPVL